MEDVSAQSDLNYNIHETSFRLRINIGRDRMSERINVSIVGRK